MSIDPSPTARPAAAAGAVAEVVDGHLARRDGEVRREVVPHHRRRVGSAAVLVGDLPAAQREAAQAEQVREFHALARPRARLVRTYEQFALHDVAVRVAHDVQRRPVQLDGSDAQRPAPQRQLVERERAVGQAQQLVTVAGAAARDQAHVAHAHGVREAVRKVRELQLNVQVGRDE